MGNKNCLFARHKRLTGVTWSDDQCYSSEKHIIDPIASSSQTPSTQMDQSVCTESPKKEDDVDREDKLRLMSPYFSQGLKSISEKHAFSQKLEMTMDPYEFKESQLGARLQRKEKHLQGMAMKTRKARTAPPVDEIIERHLNSPKKCTDAFASRLANARKIQVALSSQSSPASTRQLSSDESSGACSSTARISDYEECSSVELTPRYDFKRQKQKQMCMEFEKTTSISTIWEEITRMDKVVEVAMSRTWIERPEGESLNNTMRNKPLLLAAGHEDGTVFVVEILDDSSDKNYPKKLGDPFEINRCGRIRSLDFSADGKFLAVAGDECAASIFLIKHITSDGYSKESKRLELSLIHEIERVDRIYAARFSPDSLKLAIGGFDGSVVVVLVEDESQTPQTLVDIARDALIFCVDWSPDGRHLAIGGSDKVCAIYSTDTWELSGEIKRLTSVQTIKWSPDGMFLAVGDQDVTVFDLNLFSALKGIPLKIQSDGLKHCSKFMYRIISLCWSPSGRYLIVCGSENSCVIIESKNFSAVNEICRRDHIACIAWGQLKTHCGNNRHYVALGGDSGKIAIMKTGIEAGGDSSVGEIDDISSSTSSSYISLNDEWVLREGAFHDIADTFDHVPKYAAFPPEQGNITAVAFSRGSKTKSSTYLSYAADDNSVTIRKTAGWDIAAHIQFPKPIRCMMFSNGGKFFALGGDDGVVYIILVSSWSVIVEQNISGTILSLSFSKNNERLAVGSSDGLVTLFDPRNGWTTNGDIDNSESAVVTIDWSSQNLAIGRENGIVTVHETDKVFSNFYLPNAELSRNHPVQSVAFGVSGRFLATASKDGMVGIYSSKSGWVLCHQIKIGYSVTSVSWSPTGRYLGFTGESKMFRIIDTFCWAEVDEVSQICSSIHDEKNVYFSDLAFSQDGNFAAFAGSNAELYIVETNQWHLLLSMNCKRQSERLIESKFHYI